MGFLGSAEYLLHRLMMTPTIVVSGFGEIDDDDALLREDVMTTFNDFIDRYKQNANASDKIKNGW